MRTLINVVVISIEELNHLVNTHLTPEIEDYHCWLEDGNNEGAELYENIQASHKFEMFMEEHSEVSAVNRGCWVPTRTILQELVRREVLQPNHYLLEA